MFAARKLFEAGMFRARSISRTAESMNAKSRRLSPGYAIRCLIAAGRHCNEADRAAARLARLGRKVKKMIGGAGRLER